MASKLTGKDLATLDMEALQKKLTTLRKEYFTLRVQKTEGGRTAATTNRLSDVQKDIARVMTFIRKIQIKNVQAKYEGKEIVPIMLRPRTTRAFRLALTAKQQQMQVAKVAKRQYRNPAVKFALK